LKTYRILMQIESYSGQHPHYQIEWNILARTEKSARRKAYERLGYRDGEILGVIL